ncbi:MAG: hypothetical protein UY60_C0026G0008 [Parcubacteria group bacterium GW2011_GWB1_50_9]|nr:MAG: hypothetical protein UY60_C0026G0008 [Parcubacteria group bacterium GW2011_GWB1_50_9]
MDSTKKNILVLCIILFLGAILFLVFRGGDGRSLEKIVGETKQISIQELGITFLIPTDWEEKMKTGGAVGAFFSAQSPGFSALMLTRDDGKPKFQYANGAILNIDAREGTPEDVKKPPRVRTEEQISLGGIQGIYYILDPGDTIENASLYAFSFSSNGRNFMASFGKSNDYEKGEIKRSAVRSVL